MAMTFMSMLNAGATREQLQEWCRGKTQSYAVPFSGVDARVACRVLGKYLMYTFAGDSALTPHLALDGIWEPWITMAIARHVKRGMRCMDVGACYGYFSLLMADIVGPTGRVQAWEPAWNHELLTNVNVNGFDVDVVGKAMASQQAILGVKYPSGRNFFNAGDTKMVPGDRISPIRQAAPPAAERWDFIKIDVEGAEADVWQALAGVREQSPDLTVCMEFTPEKHESPTAFLELLRRDGFELGTVGHDGVPRRCSRDEALVPDTGGFRMLWLTRSS